MLNDNIKWGIVSITAIVITAMFKIPQEANAVTQSGISAIAGFTAGAGVGIGIGAKMVKDGLSSRIDTNKNL